MPHISEYDVENRFIDCLESIGYEYIELKDYCDVLKNFKERLEEFNKDKLKACGVDRLSDAEFDRVMIHLDNKSVYESAKLLRDTTVVIGTLRWGRQGAMPFSWEQNTLRLLHRRRYGLLQ